MIHLVKLCVGINSVEQLESHRASDERQAAAYGPNRHYHRTRMSPRRRDEIVGRGSIYWVISGAIRCRQKIAGLEPVTGADGRSYCDIVMEADLIRTLPQPRRPFQGWRYLKVADAPGDLASRPGEGGDSAIAEDLVRLGLI